MRFRPGQQRAGGEALAVDPHRKDASIFVDSSTEEREILRVPFASRCSAVFGPRGVAEMVAGTIRLYAVVAGGERVRLAQKILVDATTPVLLEGGAGCDHYIVTAIAGAAPSATRPNSYVYMRSFDGMSGGAGGAKVLTLLAGQATTASGSVAKQTIGRAYFDPATFTAGSIAFEAILATNDAVTPQPAFIDLYDVDGVVTGIPGVVAGSQQSVSSLAPTRVSVALPALLGVSGAGIFEARLWVGAAAGAVVEATGVQLVGSD